MDFPYPLFGCSGFLLILVAAIVSVIALTRTAAMKDRLTHLERELELLRMASRRAEQKREAPIASSTAAAPETPPSSTSATVSAPLIPSAAPTPPASPHDQLTDHLLKQREQMRLASHPPAAARRRASCGPSNA